MTNYLNTSCLEPVKKKFHVHKSILVWFLCYEFRLSLFAQVSIFQGLAETGREERRPFIEFCRNMFIDRIRG